MRGYVEFIESQEREGLGTEYEDWLDQHYEAAEIEDENA